MTSIGITASAIMPPAYADVLSERFNDFTTNSWGNVTGSTTIIAGGRTGNGAQLTGTSSLHWTIPAINESDYLTIGFAFKLSAIGGANRHLLIATSDTNTTNHTTIRVTPAGALAAVLGGVTGGAYATSADSLITSTSIFYYVELQVRLHDTLGSATLRLNGTTVASATNVDTKFGGTKNVYDAIRLMGTTGVTEVYDDVYLTMGAGAPFKGPITIP